MGRELGVSLDLSGIHREGTMTTLTSLSDRLAGPVVLPGDPDFDDARRVFDLNQNITPGRP